MVAGQDELHRSARPHQRVAHVVGVAAVGDAAEIVGRDRAVGGEDAPGSLRLANRRGELAFDRRPIVDRNLGLEQDETDTGVNLEHLDQPRAHLPTGQEIGDGGALELGAPRPLEIVIAEHGEERYRATRLRRERTGRCDLGRSPAVQGDEITVRSYQVDPDAGLELVGGEAVVVEVVAEEDEAIDGLTASLPRHRFGHRELSFEKLGERRHVAGVAQGEDRPGGGSLRARAGGRRRVFRDSTGEHEDGEGCEDAPREDRSARARRSDVAGVAIARHPARRPVRAAAFDRRHSRPRALGPADARRERMRIAVSRASAAVASDPPLSPTPRRTEGFARGRDRRRGTRGQPCRGSIRTLRRFRSPWTAPASWKRRRLRATASMPRRSASGGGPDASHARPSTRVRAIDGHEMGLPEKPAAAGDSGDRRGERCAEVPQRKPQLELPLDACGRKEAIGEQSSQDSAAARFAQAQPLARARQVDPSLRAASSRQAVRPDERRVEARSVGPSERQQGVHEFGVRRQVIVGRLGSSKDAHPSSSREPMSDEAREQQGGDAEHRIRNPARLGGREPALLGDRFGEGRPGAK